VSPLLNPQIVVILSRSRSDRVEGRKLRAVALESP